MKGHTLHDLWKMFQRGKSMETESRMEMLGLKEMAREKDGTSDTIWQEEGQG